MELKRDARLTMNGTMNVRARATIYLAILAVGSVVAGFIRINHPSASASPVSVSSAPALTGKDWINLDSSDRARVIALKGHVTILHFWTFECINCEHNLPYYAKWQKGYATSDVQVIGIHTPELSDERDPANVKAAVKRLGITYPVLIDGESTNWNAYHQEYWPTVYLIDKHGNIRYKWAGELGDDGFAEATKAIEKLRKES
jgi:thiol-disulfide isomerase/thioredoxin